MNRQHKALPFRSERRECVTPHGDEPLTELLQVMQAAPDCRVSLKVHIRKDRRKESIEIAPQHRKGRKVNRLSRPIFSKEYRSQCCALAHDFNRHCILLSSIKISQRNWKKQGFMRPRDGLIKFSSRKTAQYEVIGVARHSETLEPLVVYRPLYDDSGLWLRPHAMFFGTLEVDGATVQRFSPLALS